VNELNYHDQGYKKKKPECSGFFFLTFEFDSFGVCEDKERTKRSDRNREQNCLIPANRYPMYDLYHDVMHSLEYDEDSFLFAP
jgi:hypothetical protein